MAFRSRFVSLPENRSALEAVGDLADAPDGPLLFLHGLPGSGKSHLANDLVEAFTLTDSARTAQIHAAGELGRGLMMYPLERRPLIKEAIGCDLLVVEDIQHLPEAACEELAYIFDRRAARRKPGLVTSIRGPADLAVSSRLRSRLAGGLVLGIRALSAKSRMILARTWCAERKLKVTDEVLGWLARDPGGARPILGKLTLLEVLAKQFPPPITMKVVEGELAEEKNLDEGPLESLLAEVATRFRVSQKQLLGPTRVRNVVWPRQVAMYIARMGGYSFPDIGSFFHRDHTTVMHSCEKVAEAIASDLALAQEVEELQARTGVSEAPTS